MKKDTATKIINILSQMYPDAGCALDHRSVFELLICVVLSAQTTDKSVNKVTPALFEAYPDIQSLSAADPDDVAEYIRSIGMSKTKSKNIVNLSKKLLSDYNGEVPEDYESLISLPGVGRKTANVVLAEGFGHQRIAVDTHVFRVSNRIGLADAPDVLKTEEALMRVIPEDMWSHAHHCLIFHGRNLCKAAKPGCKSCNISKYCKYYAENLPE